MQAGRLSNLFIKGFFMDSRNCQVLLRLFNAFFFFWGGGGVDSLASFHLPGAIVPKFRCMQSKTWLQFYLMQCMVFVYTSV